MNTLTENDLPQRLQATKDRLCAAADYDGAAAVREAMEALRPAPAPKYGGPHDDAADAWAAGQGMRVVRWGEFRAGEQYIAWSMGEPSCWTSVATVGVGESPKPRYIVEPLPQPATAKPDPGDMPEDDTAKYATKMLAEAKRLIRELAGKTSASPAAPPAPEVPATGYWERDGKRYVLVEPVEYRDSTEHDEAWLCPRIEGGWMMCATTAIAGCGNRFILRELVEPTPPAGYEVEGWRRPKADEWYISSSGLAVWGSGWGSHFRWCLRKVPAIRRYTIDIHHDGDSDDIDLSGVPVIVDTHSHAPRLDRELIMLEELERRGSGSYAYDRTAVAARLAEIRGGKV